VFYCKDASKALTSWITWWTPPNAAALTETIVAEAFKEVADRAQPRQSRQGRSATHSSTSVPRQTCPPTFLGPSRRVEYPAGLGLPYIHKPELFRLSWGAKKRQGAEWARLEATSRPAWSAMKRAAKASGRSTRRPCMGTSRAVRR